MSDPLCNYRLGPQWLDLGTLSLTCNRPSIPLILTKITAPVHGSAAAVVAKAPALKIDVIDRGKTGYTGEKITREDYEAAGDDIGCEAEVLMAIGEKESGKLRDLGLGAFDKQHRPTILYERHYFSKATLGKYDKDHHDISAPKGYRLGATPKRRGVAYDDGEHYGLFSWQYLKLARAYALNRDAALRSCSWGKFQIMGDSYAACGYASADAFVLGMCRSEKEHLAALVGFCKANIADALKKKDWQAIAFGYNGNNYKANNYDTDLMINYARFKAAAAGAK